MSFVGSNILAGASGQGGATGYEIERSLRFNSADSAYLNRTPSSAGNRRTWTWSGWVKRSTLGGQKLFIAGASGTEGGIQFYSGTDNNGIEVYDYSGSYTTQLDTSQLFRDVSAWYHIVLAYDTTQSTAANRVKLYINGLQVDDFATETYPSQNYEGHVNNNIAHTLGAISNPSSFFNGYLADVHFIDGQALAATDFGETDDNGVWQPKKFNGTYGPIVDQSQTWSNSITTALRSGDPATKGFDGNPDTNTVVAASDAIMNLDFSGITVNSKIEIRSETGYNTPNCSVTVGGVTTNAGGDPNTGVPGTNGTTTKVFNVSGTLTNIKIGKINSGRTRLSQLFIDGKLLVDSGVTVTGNSFHLDFADNSSNAALGTDTSGNSNTWTVNNLIAAGEAVSTSAITNVSSADNTGTISATAAGWQSAEKAINGNDSDAAPSNNNVAGTITFGSNLVGVTKVRAKTRFYGGGTAKLYKDGSVVHSSTHNNNSATQYYTIYEGPAIEIDQYWQQMSSYGASDDFWALEINNVLVKTSSNGGNLINTIPGSEVTLTTTDATNYGSFAVGDSVNKGATISAKNSGTPSITVDAGSWANGDYVVKPSNINADNLRDTPTNGTQTDTGAGGEVVGNYAVINPLDNPGEAPYGNQGATITNGNLDFAATGGFYAMRRATVQMPSSGKWYMECTVNGTGYSPRGVSSQASGFGLCKSNVITDGGAPITDGDTLWLGDSGYGKLFGSTTRTEWKAADIDEGDIISLAVDMDASTFNFRVNNVSVQNGSINTTDAITPFVFSSSTSYTNLSVNFGQRAFAYTAPSGYKALCTANLPEPTIADGSQYFDTKLWSGNNTARSISTNFSPDFVWTKLRNVGNNHNLFDSVRGVEKKLRSSADSAEATESGSLTAFNSDGFSLGTSGNVNGNGYTFVAWAWDAGSSNTTIPAGSLNSSVYDQSQNWTNLISFNAGAWNGNGTNPFDADATNYDYGNTTRANGGYATLDISSLTGSRVISVTSQQTEVTITHDGGTTTFTPPHTSQITHTFGAVTNPTSIKFDGLNGNSQFVLVGVSVDGARLINSGISLPNVPSIASTVRANPSAGFSIVKYDGNDTGNTTIGHGLNAVPSMIIVKPITSSGPWPVYTSATGNGNKLYLNTTNASSGSSNWNSTDPTSTVFSVPASSETNANSTSYITYCFSPVEGYSAMGSYTGNGSADGPFVFTGFRSRFILFKSSSRVSNWQIYDTARDPYNAMDSRIKANATDAEASQSGYDLDILSNGFRPTGGSNDNYNETGATYFYAAFAEHPFKNARAR